MKKFFALLCVILFLSILNSCKAADKLKVEDYFPIVNNSKYIYEGSGNEYASYSVYTEYTANKKMQQRILNGGSELVKVIEIKDGKATKIYSLGETYYRQNLLDSKGVEEILLQEPIKKDTSWTLPDKSTRTITNIDMDITTPLGTYKAIEVTTASKNGKSIEYYAKDVGLIKSVFITGDIEITSTLSKIENNTPLIQKVNFYFPNIEEQKNYFKSKEISFNTNDDTKDVLEKAYKDLINNNMGKVISNSVVINSLSLGKDKIVYIDFNSAFKTEMNAGALYESMILQSIVNTFGNYYQTDKVIITVDNKPYESGHIKMNPGQTFPVKQNNAVELK